MSEKTQVNNINKTNDVMGWLITFDVVIAGIFSAIFPLGRFDFVGFVLCLADKINLKKQKNIDISIWRCFLTPTYLYKRAKLMNEPMTKFYINLVLYIVLSLLVVIYCLLYI